MDRLTDESKNFHHAVYTVVSKIPYGHVTSYGKWGSFSNYNAITALISTNIFQPGHIAYLLNKPQNSRQVGSSLKHCDLILESLKKELPPDQRDSYFDLDTLPWWRVINSVGKISPRGNSNGEYVQAERLREEGVMVSSGHKVDLEDFGWFPDDIEFL